MWRTADGGATWERTPMMIAWRFATIEGVRLFVDAADSRILYFTGMLGISPQLSLDGGATWMESEGRHWRRWTGVDPVRSGWCYALYSHFLDLDLLVSRDRGETWTRADLYLAGRDPFVLVDHVDSRIMYVGATDARSHVVARLFRSEDVAESWNPIQLGEHDYLAFATDPRQEAGLYGMDNQHTWHSPDGGRTWQRVALAPTPNLHRLAASPVAPGLLFAWSRYGGSGDAERTAWRSADGGSTWEQLPFGEVTRILPHPRDPERVYAVTSEHWLAGPMMTSRDAGRTWRQIGPMSAVRYPATVRHGQHGQLLVSRLTSSVRIDGNLTCLYIA